MNFKLKLAFLSFIIFSATINVFSQEKESAVKINYQVNTNKSVDFNFEKTDEGTYTVMITFSSLTNTMGSNVQIVTVKGFGGRATTLTPTNKEQGVGFSYTYSYIRGKLNPKFNKDFVYLLPCKNGGKVKVGEASFVGATYFGNTTPDDWKVYRFYTKTEDTVTVVRKGIVVDIVGSNDTDGSEAIAFTSKTNSITVEHIDGTLATYTGFKKASIGVKVGQTVYPGTALGLNTKTNGNAVYGISLMLTYLKSTDFGNLKNRSLSSSKSFYGFITPHFCTNESADVTLISQQDYTSTYNPEIIKKEFSKKELKMNLK
ncbi:M23 family metallopeptidase [Pedobacter mucosus]|uniref:M23 family metallopeptidase n=1 Tax=Pedobacter mucosus TaxID=2895286 RepID=UPI001EE447CA|nr:M23 family metallopeptidase [Pedobacter mucosus]UKT64083.1 M23 family metallopeptidase [Pedobacter mucosus]